MAVDATQLTRYYLQLQPFHAGERERGSEGGTRRAFLNFLLCNLLPLSSLFSQASALTPEAIRMTARNVSGVLHLLF